MAVAAISGREGFLGIDAPTEAEDSERSRGPLKVVGYWCRHWILETAELRCSAVTATVP